MAELYTQWRKANYEDLEAESQAKREALTRQVLGAVAYARKEPDPAPEVFGYHEVFHALVVAAVACHLEEV